MTLERANLSKVVRLPEGEDINEWLAVNVADIFKEVKMIFGIVCDACTEETCPIMSAGGTEYQWSDPSSPSGSSIAAPLYIEYTLSWIADQLDDDSLFPSEVGKAFPPHFRSICDRIMKYLLRVYAHVMTVHADKIDSVKASPHVNASLRFFLLFAREFDLVQQEEYGPISDIVGGILNTANISVS